MKRILLILVPLGLVAWLFAPAETPPPSEPTRTARAAAKPLAVHQSQQPLLLAALDREAGVPGAANPFAAKSWVAAPAPVPQAAAAPPPPPAAPPLPFTFAGALTGDNGQPVYYLARGDQSYAVSVGETFAGNYRLDGVEGGKLQITYLPLSIRQVLPFNLDS